MNARHTAGFLGVAGGLILTLTGCSANKQATVGNTQTSVANHVAPTNESSPAQQPKKVTEIQMTDSMHGWMIARGVYTKILHTSDGGQTWLDVTPLSPVPNQASYMPIVDAIDTTSAIVTVASNMNSAQTLLYMTADSGAQWTQVNLPDSVQTDLIGDIHFSTPRTGWISVSRAPISPLSQSNPILLRTTDGGHTWSTYDTKDVPNWPHTGPIVGMDAVDATSLWVTVSGGESNMAKLGNFSPQRNSWLSAALPDPFDSSPIQQTGPSIAAFKFFSPERGTAVEEWPASEDMPPTELAILSTQDGGVHWQTSSLLHLPDVQQIGMAAHVQILSPGDVIVINGATLYHTVDGGLHWSTIENKDTVPLLWQVDFVNDSVAFGSASGEPIMTTDGGRTWHPWGVVMVQR